MVQKIKRTLFIPFGAALLLLGCSIDSAETHVEKSTLAGAVHADLSNLKEAIFNLEQLEILLGTKLQLSNKSVSNDKEIYLPSSILRAPYSAVEYERRDHRTWAEVTLTIDRHYCISSFDFNAYFPMGDGVPRNSDHLFNSDFEIGFGDEKSRIWIYYEKSNSKQCARRFLIEAAK